MTDKIPKDNPVWNELSPDHDIFDDLLQRAYKTFKSEEEMKKFLFGEWKCEEISDDRQESSPSAGDN